MAIDYPTRTTTEREDIETIASFFRVGHTSRTMEKLTGLGHSSLDRVIKGETARTNRAAHVAVVAAYVRELHELMIEMSRGQQQPIGDMSSWLSTTQLQTRRGPLFAGDVLAEADLAREALAELRRLTW